MQMDDDVIVIQRRAKDLLRKVNKGEEEFQRRPACKNLQFLQSGKLGSCILRKILAFEAK